MQHAREGCGSGAARPQKCDDGALQRDEMASGLKVTGDISGFRAEDGDTVSESDDSGQGDWRRRILATRRTAGICDAGQPPTCATAGKTLKKWTRQGEIVGTTVPCDSIHSPAFHCPRFTNGQSATCRKAGANRGVLTEIATCMLSTATDNDCGN